MQIAGSDFLFEQNNRLRNSLLDYSNKTAAQNNASEKPAEVSSVNTQKLENEEIGATLRLSTDGMRVASKLKEMDAASASAPTNFSTTDTASKENTAAEQTATATANGNAVLNQYRFFVQSAHYTGAEGTVRRLS